MEDLTGAIEVLVFPKVLAEYGVFVKAENAVIMQGRVSLRENEAPKLLCERVKLAENANAPVPSVAARESEALKSAEPWRNLRFSPDQTLYLRIFDESGKMLKRLQGLFTMFPGTRRVILYFPQSGKKLAGDAALLISDDYRLYKELYRLLGEENVKLK